MAPGAPRLRVAEAVLLERDVRLRLPFRFGVVTLTEATQAFVRARITLTDGHSGWGAAAEMLAPKWFDKNPALTDEDNAEQLRESLRIARADSVLFIEQPITRRNALLHDVGPLGTFRPVIIDESDADLDAFPEARARGYRGVSSKSCKGFYKSLLNAARCAMWNREAGRGAFFMSAEDLTTQAGLGLQQDLALVSLLGLGHVERNGHHYVRGLAALPPGEQAAWLAAHPDLYARDGNLVRLRITSGQLAIGSLAAAGFAAGAEPEWSSMREGR
jgi:hypothetical protein